MDAMKWKFTYSEGRVNELANCSVWAHSPPREEGNSARIQHAQAY